MRKYETAMRQTFIILFLFLTSYNAFCQKTVNAKASFANALKKMQTGEYAFAIQDLNEAIAKDSTYADAYFLRGKIKTIMGKSEEGCIDAKRAADLGNEEAKLVYEQYCKVMTEEEIANKVKPLDSLAKLNPNRPDIFYNISNVYFDAKQYQKAIFYCDKAIAIDPKFTYAYYNKGACLINLGEPIKGCELINKAADMGDELAKQMKPKCDAVLKAK